MSTFIVPVSSDYDIDLNVDGSNVLYIDNNTSTNIMITLPDCSQNDSLEYHFFNNSRDVLVTFTVIPYSGQSIVGSDNGVILTNGNTLHLISYNVQWYQIV